MDFDFDDIAERADNLRSARKVEPQPQPQPNIAWIDTETSGLDERDGSMLLEVACIVTDSELNELGTGHAFGTSDTTCTGCGHSLSEHEFSSVEDMTYSGTDATTETYITCNECDLWS